MTLTLYQDKTRKERTFLGLQQHVEGAAFAISFTGDDGSGSRRGFQKEYSYWLSMANISPVAVFTFVVNTA